MRYIVKTERRYGLLVYFPVLIDHSDRVIRAFPDLTRMSEAAVQWEVIPKLQGARV